MISAFRRYLDTWVVKIFFGIMVVSFIFWGVGDFVRLTGTDTWVAKVAGTTIEAPALQAEFSRAMANVTRNLPPGQDASPEMRRQVGDDTLQRLITQAAVTAELRALRIVAPDAQVAQMAREVPSFRGPDGKFSKPVFDMVLRNNGLTEGRFLDMLRGDVASRQLLTAVGAGVTAPETLSRAIYLAEYQKRSVRMAEFVLANAPAPATPEEAVLRRWFDNHPDLYRTPEYRRVQAVLLTPQRLGQDVTVSDDELRAAYDRMRPQLIVPGRRTAEVIAAPDEERARALAEEWRAGADWTGMQGAAGARGASAVALEDATETQFPDPDLGRAVFGAQVNTVSGPVKAALSWYVIKVTAATAGEDPDFAQALDRVREKVVADKAADLVYDRANKVDALLANGTSLNDMPDNLGLIGLQGTLDAEGMTAENEPAPIPGGVEIRAAIIQSAFLTQRGDPPRLQEVRLAATGGSAYFALIVEDITPAALKSFDAVRERVSEDWTADQRRRYQEEAAARMLAALKSGQSFADAALIADVAERVTPVTTRGEAPEGVPGELVRAMFRMKPDEPSMIETAEAFIVARLAEVIDPDPATDPDGFRNLGQAITRALGGDLGTAFTDAVRQRANPRINQKTLDQITQP
jgi:peptidyl-prolyl cis-trans isomerase D